MFAKLPLLAADFRLSGCTQYPYVTPCGIRSQDCWILLVSHSNTGNFGGHTFSLYKHIFKEAAECFGGPCLFHTGSGLPTAHLSFNLQAKVLFLVFCGYSEPGNRTFSYACFFPIWIPFFLSLFPTGDVGPFSETSSSSKFYSVNLYSCHCLKFYFFRNKCIVA